MPSSKDFDRTVEMLMRQRSLVDNTIDLVRAVQGLENVSISISFNQHASPEEWETVQKAMDRHTERARQLTLDDEEDPDANPGGAAGALKIFEEHPGEQISPQELANLMLADGWRTTSDNPARAARAAANRLRRDGHPIELQRGRFTYRPEGAGDAADADEEGGP